MQARRNDECGLAASRCHGKPHPRLREGNAQRSHNTTSYIDFFTVSTTFPRKASSSASLHIKRILKFT